MLNEWFRHREKSTDVGNVTDFHHFTAASSVTLMWLMQNLADCLRTNKPTEMNSSFHRLMALQQNLRTGTYAQSLTPANCLAQIQRGKPDTNEVRTAMTFSLTLPHQRSAGRGTDFWRYIFYTKEEQGAELDFNRWLTTPAKCRGGPDFWHWIFYTKEEQGAEMDFNWWLATPAKCRARQWFLSLDFLRQRRTRRRNGFQQMTCYVSKVQGRLWFLALGFLRQRR